MQRSSPRRGSSGRRSTRVVVPASAPSRIRGSVEGRRTGSAPAPASSAVDLDRRTVSRLSEQARDTLAEIAVRLAAGFSSSEVAEALNVSTRTVRARMAALREELLAIAAEADPHPNGGDER